MSQTADVIILSPHLDDAVLAAGGMISREAAAGRRVEVWTCFTAGPPLDTIPPFLRVMGDYAARRQEDERALALLGAGHRWFDLHERVWQYPPLTRFYHTFHTPPASDQLKNVPALRAIARELLSGTAEFYAPLAVGHHHDHVAVALAVLQEMLALRAFDRVRFYEDCYAHGGACRRAHFVTRRRCWRFFDAPGWASPRMGLLLVGAALCAHGPQIQDYLPEAARLQWSSTDAPVHLDDGRRKLAAVAEYASQVRAFGGIRAVSAFLRQVHKALGGERFWRAKP